VKSFVFPVFRVFGVFRGFLPIICVLRVNILVSSPRSPYELFPSPFTGKKNRQPARGRLPVDNQN
jgi:hypothetical protein